MKLDEIVKKLKTESNDSELNQEIENLLFELNSYREMKKQGLWAELPYALGTETLYMIGKKSGLIHQLDARKISLSLQNGRLVYTIGSMPFTKEHFGKYLFLTEQEATKAILANKKAILANKLSLRDMVYAYSEEYDGFLEYEIEEIVLNKTGKIYHCTAYDRADDYTSLAVLDTLTVSCSDFSKTVFLTLDEAREARMQEQAEQAIKNQSLYDCDEYDLD